jgi:hypothetical protein
MAGSRTPGSTGLDPDAALEASPPDTHPIVGLHDEAQALDSTPKIIRVTRNWGDPPTPTVTSTPKIAGKTLKEALAELEKLPEWGTGGGNLSGPEGEIKLQPDEKAGGYTVDLVGDFFITLPSWDGYASATAEQKQAWDNMITKLRKHEQQHVTIAYNGAQKMIRTLTNLPVTQAAQKMQEVTDDTQAKQDDFDSAGKTNHGANAWGGFPKVELDTSADPPPPPPPTPPPPKP